MVAGSKTIIKSAFICVHQRPTSINVFHVIRGRKEVYNIMVDRLHFAHLPTPIEELPRLTKTLDGPHLLVKRDDQTGLAFGGNKTRKLEFLVAEAQEQGAKTLISGGAMQSNHCRQTAAAAAKYGFECTLVLTG